MTGARGARGKAARMGLAEWNNDNVVLTGFFVGFGGIFVMASLASAILFSRAAPTRKKE